MTTEIPPKNWALLCDKITELPHDAVNIRLTGPDGATREGADNVPLVKIAFQKQNDACSDVLTIETGLPDERPMQHEILEPIRIILRRTTDGSRFGQLEILAESGTTEVRFRPGISPSLLEPLAH